MPPTVGASPAGRPLAAALETLAVRLAAAEHLSPAEVRQIVSLVTTTVDVFATATHDPSARASSVLSQAMDQVGALHTNLTDLLGRHQRLTTSLEPIFQALLASQDGAVGPTGSRADTAAPSTARMSADPAAAGQLPTDVKHASAAVLPDTAALADSIVAGDAPAPNVPPAATGSVALAGALVHLSEAIDAAHEALFPAADRSGPAAIDAPATSADASGRAASDASGLTGAPGPGNPQAASAGGGGVWAALGQRVEQFQAMLSGSVLQMKPEPGAGVPNTVLLTQQLAALAGTAGAGAAGQIAPPALQGLDAFRWGLLVALSYEAVRRRADGRPAPRGRCRVCGHRLQYDRCSRHPA